MLPRVVSTNLFREEETIAAEAIACSWNQKNRLQHCSRPHSNLPPEQGGALLLLRLSLTLHLKHFAATGPHLHGCSIPSLSDIYIYTTKSLQPDPAMYRHTKSIKLSLSLVGNLTVHQQQQQQSDSYTAGLYSVVYHCLWVQLQV